MSRTDGSSMGSWDERPSTHSVSHCRRPVRALASLVLVCGTAVVAAAVVGASRPLPKKVSSSVRTFLWISLACIFVLWPFLALVNSSSRVRARTLAWQRSVWPAHGSHVASLYAVGSVLALFLGSYGFVAISAFYDGTEYSAVVDGSVGSGRHSPWPLVLATAIGAMWIIVCVVLLAMSVITLVRNIQPGQETPPAIMLLRCSCCSVTARRMVLVLPFAALSVSSLLLWFRAQSQWRDDRHCASTATATKGMARLLLGATVIFSCMLLSIVAPSAWQWMARLTQPTHAQRQRVQAATFVLLLLYGVTAVAWAVLSCVRLHSYSRYQNAATFSDETEPLDCGRLLKDTTLAVRFTTGALLSVGVFLLSVTCCCRLERHLLSSSTASYTPSVDLTMLSPHAVRSPALTKSPNDMDTGTSTTSSNRPTDQIV